MSEDSPDEASPVSQEGVGPFPSDSLPEVNLSPSVILTEPLSGVRSFHKMCCPHEKGKSPHDANAMSAWSGANVIFKLVCKTCGLSIIYAKHVPQEYMWNPLGYQRSFEQEAVQLIKEYRSNDTYRKLE